MKAIYFEPTLTSWGPLCGSGVHTLDSSGEPEGTALAPTFNCEVQNKFPHGLPGKYHQLDAYSQSSCLIRPWKVDH